MSNVVDYAKRYLARYQFRTVGILRNAKHPGFDGWQHTNLRTQEEIEAHFTSRFTGVGIILGYDGLVDCDLDCAEAVLLAPYFLPATAMRFGRASVGAAHYVYRCAPAAITEEWADPVPTKRLEGGAFRKAKKEAMLLELRGGTEMQTVFPPFHPSHKEDLVFGEPIGEPAIVDAEELRSSCEWLASACLLARYWPESGARHDAMLALVGALAREYPKDLVQRFLVDMYRAVPDADPASLQGHRMLDHTYEALETGKPVSGLTKLAEFMNADAVKKVGKWLKLVPDVAAKKKMSCAKLIEALETFEYFVNDKKEAYVSLEIQGSWQTHKVRSSFFSGYVKSLYYEQTLDLLAPAMAEGILDLLANRATARTQDVFVRFGWAGEKAYLDLCNEKWQVVEIDQDGWRILERSPVAFRRDKAMLPLPAPEPGGKLSDLFGCVNAQSQADQIAFIAWLLSPFNQDGTLPILSVVGAHGSGKSATIEKLKKLVDDSSIALCSAPRNEWDLSIAAKNSAVIAYDNLSGLPEWLSDCLCKVCDGSGFRVRQHYKNDEENIFCERRSLIVSGIDNAASRADLADRCIHVSLGTLNVKETEEELDARFEASRTKVLGALLDVVSAGVKLKKWGFPFERPDPSIRMSDFLHWMVCCETALGWRPDTFQHFYAANRQDLTEQNVDEDSFAVALIKRCEAAPTKWAVTAQEILLALAPPSMLDRTWPTSTAAVGKRVRRLIPSLLAIGIEVKQCRDRTRRWFEFRVLKR